MVQLCPSKAGFELAAGHNDRFDLRLAQTRFVVIGLEECTRAAARHLSSCRIEGAQMRLEAKRKAAAGRGLCRFLDSKADRSLSQHLWAVRVADAEPPKAIHRTASDRQPRSDPIPRTRNPRR